MNQLNELEVTILERLGGDGVTGLKLGSLGMDRWKMWLQGFSCDWNDSVNGRSCRDAVEHLAELGLVALHAQRGDTSEYRLTPHGGEWLRSRRDQAS
jgi:hypothetical protein